MIRRRFWLPPYSHCEGSILSGNISPIFKGEMVITKVVEKL